MLKLTKLDFGGLGSAKTAEYLRNLYIESFPPEERRSWDSISALSDDEAQPYSVYAIESRGIVLGMLTLWTFDTISYIEHLAIDANCRGQGIGSQALEAIIGMIGADRPLVVEVEPEHVSTQAKRRIAFYEKLGFETLQYDYTQPSYASGLPPVTLRLMARNAQKGPKAQEIEAILHKKVYGQ